MHGVGGVFMCMVCVVSVCVYVACVVWVFVTIMCLGVNASECAHFLMCMCECHLVCASSVFVCLCVHYTISV